MPTQKHRTQRRTNAAPTRLAKLMAAHGFRREGMGGNTSAFRRVDGDGTEYVVILAGSEGHAPSKLTDAVDLFTETPHADPTERRFASVRDLLHALEDLDRPLQARASLMYSRAQAGGSVTTERGVSYTGLQLLAYVDVVDASGAPVGGGVALHGIPEEGAGPLFVSSADFNQLADGRLHTVDGVFYPRARWANPGEQDVAVVTTYEPRKFNAGWRKHARGSSPKLHTHWRWVWPNGAKGEVFSLPATIRSEDDMRTHHDFVARKVAIAADFDGARSASLRSALRKSGHRKPPHRPKLDVEILPQRFVLDRGREEVVGWRVEQDGEHLGDFELVAQAPRASARFFGRAP